MSRRHPVASSSHMSLDSRINAWGSAGDLHSCVGFRGSKKVEKHCVRELRKFQANVGLRESYETHPVYSVICSGGCKILFVVIMAEDRLDGMVSC